MQHDEDAQVERERDEERDEEAGACRVHDVRRRLVQHARVHVRQPVELVGLAEPADERRHADGGGDEPHDADVERPLAGPARLAVPHRVERRGEAVERDHAQVPDGRRAAEHVGEQPGATHPVAERPVAEALVDGGEGEDGDREEEVGEGEVPDEAVGDGAQRVVPEERDADEEVADGGRDDHQREDGPDEDHHRERVGEGELPSPACRSAAVRRVET